MKQFVNFILIIVISALSAGVYGILHDQITYSISPEYYTLLKFQQFGFEYLDLNIRIKAGIIGFLATWWVGLFLGIAYAFVSLFLDPEKTLKVTVKSVLINICITFIAGILGYGYAVLFLSAENTNWYIPAGTKNIRNFISVGSIHNFGYMGGVSGMVAGIIYQIKKAKN